MKHLFSTRRAATCLLVLLSLLVLFHALILTGIVPYGIVWGGRLQSPAQMLAFETVSIGANLVLAGVAGAWAGHWGAGRRTGWLRGALWLMTALFGLNTVGNLLSVNPLEKHVFTPLTLVLALLSLRLALDRRPGRPAEIAGGSGSI
ncbi:hypothetical protein E5K00_07500 [Hymenobacter aquaticus]|uniref:DUF4293 family protein n=1 Tax=Hymenobacter aquaticus TaxID=1867101 RepID=A0A4Z0Q5Y0_9BACT|nr:hypothetical protein [Hymenobacter aquaticus]TGE25034.1 hypothetical protein E5K00_07500 [Hymenobacter aquaticus]